MLSLFYGIIIGMALMIGVVLYAMHKKFKEAENMMIDNTKVLLREIDILREKINKQGEKKWIKI